jgi:hypothetical protein
VRQFADSQTNRQLALRASRDRPLCYVSWRSSFRLVAAREAASHFSSWFTARRPEDELLAQRADIAPARHP